MKKIIFDRPPQLSKQEQHFADMHSFLNVLNVLACEISVIEMQLDNDNAAIMVRHGDEIIAIAQALKEGDEIPIVLKRVHEFEGKLVAAVHAVLQELDDAGVASDIRDSLANIESVFNVVHRRLEELETRSNDPDVWLSINIHEFEHQFQEVFYAIEKNSKGGYRIFFNLARKSENDYYIDLKIESEFLADTLWIPLRLNDVIRDLTANARKYTEPGGKVALAIYQNSQEIRVLIEDSGCGIPEDEIEHVVEFGYRATNVRDRPTMGGGFGLTKAAWLIHHWGGTLSIESAVGKGTIVRLQVPNKARPESELSSTN